MDLNEALWEVQWLPASGGRVRRLVLTWRALRRLILAMAVVALLVVAVNVAMPLGLRSVLGRFTVDSARRDRGILTTRHEELRELAATLASSVRTRHGRAQRVAWLNGSSPEAYRTTLTPLAAPADDDQLVTWLDGGGRALDELSAALAGATLATRCPPRALPLILPVAPGQAVPVAMFGWRVSPFTGKRVPLRGVELACPLGTDVVAPGAGQVLFAGAPGGRTAADWAQFGTVVVLDHGGGVATVLGHLGEASVRRGQVVARGQRVATSGQSGWARVPAVYFEIRWPLAGGSVPVHPALVAFDLPVADLAAALADPSGGLPADAPPVDSLVAGPMRIAHRRPVR